MRLPTFLVALGCTLDGAESMQRAGARSYYELGSEFLKMREQREWRRDARFQATAPDESSIEDCLTAVKSMLTDYIGSTEEYDAFFQWVTQHGMQQLEAAVASDLSCEESISIISYTYERLRNSSNFFGEFNRQMRSTDENFVNGRDYFTILATALEKLPALAEDTVVVRALALSEEKRLELANPRRRMKGEFLYWPAFSSATRTFQDRDKEKAIGVANTQLTGEKTELLLYEIQDADVCGGKSIQPFSMYPTEDEVLLPGGSGLQITEEPRKVRDDSLRTPEYWLVKVRCLTPAVTSGKVLANEMRGRWMRRGLDEMGRRLA